MVLIVSGKYNSYTRRNGAFSPLKTTNLDEFNAREALYTVPAVEVVKPMAVVQREAIIGTLKHFRGNLKRTSRELKLALPTLYKRLKQYGISRKEIARYYERNEQQENGGEQLSFTWVPLPAGGGLDNAGDSGPQPVQPEGTSGGPAGS